MQRGGRERQGGGDRGGSREGCSSTFFGPRLVFHPVKIEIVHAGLRRRLLGRRCGRPTHRSPAAVAAEVDADLLRLLARDSPRSGRCRGLERVQRSRAAGSGFGRPRHGRRCLGTLCRGECEVHIVVVVTIPCCWAARRALSAVKVSEEVGLALCAAWRCAAFRRGPGAAGWGRGENQARAPAQTPGGGGEEGRGSSSLLPWPASAAPVSRVTEQPRHENEFQRARQRWGQGSCSPAANELFCDTFTSS